MDIKKIKENLKTYREMGFTDIKLNSPASVLVGELDFVESLSLPPLTYGVEIEFFSDLLMQEIAISIGKSLCEEGILVDWGCESSTSKWKVIRDPSCEYELTSPILSGVDGLIQIRKICNALKGIAKVSPRCGLHVHIGAQDMSLEQVKAIVLRWLLNEDLFDEIQPRTRRGSRNGWCRALNETLVGKRTDIDTIDVVFGAQSIWDLAEKWRTRYSKLNLLSYTTHETIEFRHHAGTLNPQAICSWVIFLLFFCANAEKELHKEVQDDEPLFEALFGVAPQILRFYQKRRDKLA
jgi:hypothetical protein